MRRKLGRNWHLCNLKVCFFTEWLTQARSGGGILKDGSPRGADFSEAPLGAVNRTVRGAFWKDKTMKDLLLKTYIRFKHDDRGVTLVEYGIAIALAVLVGTGALTLLAGEIDVSLGAAGDAMPD